MSEKKISELGLQRQEDFQLIARMLSMSIHDMNNPLAVLVGQTSILEIMHQKGALTPEKIEKIVSKLKSSTESFQDRIQKLRGFYSILNPNHTGFTQLSEVIASVQYLYSKLLSDKGISFELKVAHDYTIEEDLYDFYFLIKGLF